MNPRSLAEDRLAELEAEVRRHRYRFRMAAVGYALLTVGLVVAFWIATQTLNELRDTQVATIHLVGKGQTFDCLDRQKLRAGLAQVGITVATGKFGDCQAIRRHYDQLAHKAK